MGIAHGKFLVTRTNNLRYAAYLVVYSPHARYEDINEILPKEAPKSNKRWQTVELLQREGSQNKTGYNSYSRKRGGGIS